MKTVTYKNTNNVMFGVEDMIGNREQRGEDVEPLAQ